MNKKLHCFPAIMILFIMNSCYAQPSLSKKEWIEDLSVLENAVYTKHIDPFWKNSKTKYEELFASVRNKINTTDEALLKPEVVMTGFAQILALTGDGHSGVSTKSRGDLFGLFSYNVSWFPEGLFITRADENNKNVLGGRILKIDDTPIDEAKKLVNTVSTSYHEQGFKRFSPRYFESPAVLYGLGIAKSPQQVTLTLQGENGTISTATFQRQTLKENEKTKFISLTDIATYTLPLYRQNIRKYYWFEYLPEKKILYLDYLIPQNSKEESMEAFVKRVAETVSKEDIEKFVVDIRLNPGGDQFTAWPLLAYIFSNPKINQPGKLFVITGHSTFSAATAFLEALDTKTNCIIVGTPPSDSPVYPAEDKTTVLPNCKMEVRLSDEMWNYSLDDDSRNIIEPDVTVVTTFKDYMQGKDPVMEAIANYNSAYKPAPTNTPEFVGRYLFGIDKTLEIAINNSVLRADIKGRLHTILDPVGDGKFKTGIKDVFFEFKNNELMIHYPGGSNKKLRKLAADELTAFDLILTKQFDKAAKVYEELKQKYPNNININGANLGALAFYLLVETMDFDAANALLEIALKLDPHSEVAQGLAKGVKNFGKK